MDTDRTRELALVARMEQELALLRVVDHTAKDMRTRLTEYQDALLDSDIDYNNIALLRKTERAEEALTSACVAYDAAQAVLTMWRKGQVTT